VPVVYINEVQQWLERTKLDLGGGPGFPADYQDLENAAKQQVFGEVSQLYDTSAWIDAASTPKLIRQVVSLFVAGWIYDRAYSEEDNSGGPTYGTKLEGMALTLLAGIADGTTQLEEIPLDSSAINDPSFYPNDATGTEEITDAAGNLIGLAAGSEDIKFAMGEVF